MIYLKKIIIYYEALVEEEVESSVPKTIWHQSCESVHTTSHYQRPSRAGCV